MTLVDKIEELLATHNGRRWERTLTLGECLDVVTAAVQARHDNGLDLILGCYQTHGVVKEPSFGDTVAYATGGCVSSAYKDRSYTTAFACVHRSGELFIKCAKIGGNVSPVTWFGPSENRWREVEAWLTNERREVFYDTWHGPYREDFTPISE